MRRNQKILITFLAFMATFLVVTAQVTEEQVEKDIYFILTMPGALLVSPETQAYIDSVYARIFQNSDTYIPKLEEYLILPDDLNILSQMDSLYNYGESLGLLFLLSKENSQARELVKREYNKMTSITNTFWQDLDTPSKRSENGLIYKAFSNVGDIQLHLILLAGLNKDTLFIEDCLERIDKIPEFYHGIKIYFDSVAHNNECVISKLTELYQDPDFEYSGQPALKEQIERMGGEVEEESGFKKSTSQ